MDYLIRLVQVHETFRRAELAALAVLAGVEIEIVTYLEDSPFCIIQFPSCTTPAESTAAARRFISRSILSRSIYELWGTSITPDYAELHNSIRQRTLHLWPLYKNRSFAFSVETYMETSSSSRQRELIDSFSYLGFEGGVDLKHPNEQFTIFEEYDFLPYKTPVHLASSRKPKRLYFGRWIRDSSRYLVDIHDLKKRPYISTTSMDAELALVTANLALAAPGKIIYDPFVGTGGFLVSAAQFGACVMGSDIDGRSFRGKGSSSAAADKQTNGAKSSTNTLSRRAIDNGVGLNMIKYSIHDQLIDCFTSDLTHTPLRLTPSPYRDTGWLDAIISDPPYGVREGLKVLGLRKAGSDPARAQFVDGVLSHTLPGYIAPKRPYSFTAMLDDILSFAAATLVENGRLSFWMPVANKVEVDEEPGDVEEGKGEEEQVIEIPTHRDLELVSCCVQQFGKWSRRLLTYRKRLREEIELDDDDEGELTAGEGVDVAAAAASGRSSGVRKTADELNDFRKKYFMPSKRKEQERIEVSKNED